MGKINVPWPIAMELADILEKDGYIGLARDVRKAVWFEAERQWYGLSNPNDP